MSFRVATTITPASKPIHRLQYGEIVTIIGTIWDVRARRTRSGQVIVHAVISDGSGKVQATWFNQQWLVDKLKAGMQIVISGKSRPYWASQSSTIPNGPLAEELLRTGRIVRGLSAHQDCQPPKCAKQCRPSPSNGRHAFQTVAIIDQAAVAPHGFAASTGTNSFSR